MTLPPPSSSRRQLRPRGRFVPGGDSAAAREGCGQAAAGRQKVPGAEISSGLLSNAAAGNECSAGRQTVTHKRDLRGAVWEGMAECRVCVCVCPSPIYFLL